ncbi:hypothetical protein EXIGLDRAFT_833240 [Exidia glandulosa HHB12029]|uniref:Ribosomal protein L9 domain-containing protein n=1 Tax=Exidia glandulosa HHB12029 TaxID=1314781 RepID=A0A166B130_EXIGL|nr:hypothetical protein EXIGLDRAFT_833240 [Exidia glandulosa HHB12029]
MSANLCRAQLQRHVAQRVPCTIKRGYKSDTYRLVRVQLTQDVDTVGTAGAIVEVKRGRMRNQLFPQGKANYITRKQGPQLLELPEIRPVPIATRESLASLAPIVFNARVRTLHARNAPPIPGMTIHGRGITLRDVKARLATLGYEQLEPPQAVLEWADAQSRKNGPEGGRLKALGDYGVRIKLLGGDDVILSIKVEPQVKEEEVEEGLVASAGAAKAPSTSAVKAGAGVKFLPPAAAKVAKINSGRPRAKVGVTATR